MRKIKIAKVLCSFVLLILPCSLEAQTNGSKEAIKTPREFVEEFYRWYVPEALNENVFRAWDLALEYKSSAFSPQLVRLLKEDSDAQDRCGELIGLDFDPFLYSQDPEEHYEIGEIRHNGQDYRADVFGVRSGKRFEKPALVAEFSKGSGHWYFVNFYYPEGTDLLAILKSPGPKCSVPRPPGKKIDAPGGSE